MRVRTVLGAFVVATLVAASPGYAQPRPPESVLAFDTSGSMRDSVAGQPKISTAKKQALKVLRTLDGQIVTILSVDESGRNRGTFDMRSARDRDRALRAVDGVAATSHDTNLDEVRVWVEHLAYRRQLPPGTAVYVFTDNIADPTPGHPAIDLKRLATQSTFVRGVWQLRLEVGRGIAAAAASAGPPGAVLGIRGTAYERGIGLTWDSARDAELYRVYRGDLAGGWVLLGGPRATQFVDASALPGRTYRYYVIAEGKTGLRGAPSSVVEASMPIQAPRHPVPTYLVVTLATLALLIVALALLGSHRGRDELVLDTDTGTRTVSLGLRPEIVNVLGGAVRLGWRRWPLAGRYAWSTSKVALNGRAVDENQRVRLQDGDVVTTDYGSFRYRAPAI